MSEGDSKPGRLLGSLRRVGDSFLALLQTRIQLFALEVQSEKLRCLDALLYLGLGLVLAGAGLFFGATALAIYLWRLARYAGLLALTVVLLAAAIMILWRLRERLRKEPLPFADTIAEFKKDRACLRKRD